MFYRSINEKQINNHTIEVDICEDTASVLTIDFSTISADGRYVKNTGAENNFSISDIRSIFAFIFECVEEAVNKGYTKFVANATDDKRRSLYKKVCQRAGFVIGGNTGEFAFYFTVKEVEKEVPASDVRTEDEKRALIREVILDIGESLPEADASEEVWEAFYAANEYLADYF
jgi:hypothetical protein